MSTTATLPGQETLVACWRAMTAISPGATIADSAESVVAVFPSFAPMNNAIVFAPAAIDLATEAARTADVYRRAGVQSWALWIPSGATAFDDDDAFACIDGFKRDTTTLVMTTEIDPTSRTWSAARRASISGANQAGDEPIPIDELGETEPDAPLVGWVVVKGSTAIAGAYRYLHGSDCGIYAVGTTPAWRRRGIARRLVEHVLADAMAHGARTATLQSTTAGQRMYESLGLTAAGRYEEWVPA
jgi:ribosomal protein S18 acetylase RimI-like enzyme